MELRESDGDTVELRLMEDVALEVRDAVDVREIDGVTDGVRDDDGDGDAVAVLVVEAVSTVTVMVVDTEGSDVNDTVAV